MFNLFKKKKRNHILVFKYGFCAQLRWMSDISQLAWVRDMKGELYIFHLDYNKISKQISKRKLFIET